MGEWSSGGCEFCFEKQKIANKPQQNQKRAPVPHRDIEPYLQSYLQLFSQLLNSKEASLLQDTCKTFMTKTSYSL